MIRFACPFCKKPYNAPDEYAGKMTACKKCGQAVIIPDPSGETAPVAGVTASDRSGQEAEAPAPTPEKSSPGPGAPQSGGGSRQGGATTRFGCPVCKTVYTAPVDHAGRETICKTCNAVVVPPQPVREVVLGVALPPEGAVESTLEPAPTPVKKPAAPKVVDWASVTHSEQEPLDLTDDDPDEPDEPVIRRRRYRLVRGWRREESVLVTVIALLNLIVGVLNVACGLLLTAGAGVVASHFRYDGPTGAFLGGAIGVLAVVVLLLAVPNLLAAYGVWVRAYWGYVLALVLAGINGLWALASIFWFDPCSVFLCGGFAIYTFVVLLQSKYAAEFS
jgi:hypothetical protein